MTPVRTIISIGLILYFLSKNREIANTIIAVIFMPAALTSNDEDPKKAIKIIVDVEDAISPTELERSPFNMLETLSIFLYFLKSLYKNIEIINPDRIHPKVATIAPDIPAMRIPTKEAVLTAKGPGVI